jgi:protein SCO1/2
MRQASICLTALSLLFLGAGEVGLAEGQKAEAGPRQEAGHSPASYHGGMVTPPLPKPNFILTDPSGAPFDFRAKTEGYTTLLFFGYTHCPDICPMHMSFLGSALKRLPKDVLSRFKVVFVTTDPERDHPRELRAWLDQFGKDFVGLTGSKAEIQAAQAAANVPLAKGAPSYDHSAFVLAYTRDNLAHVIYPAGMMQSDWLHDLPQLARETWTRR